MPTDDAESAAHARGPVCAVTVTYGDRYPRLTKGTVERAFISGCSHMVVVNNGLDPAAARALHADLGARVDISIVDLPGNRGSAAGFGVGLRCAVATGAGFIWLLDDDNWPEESALSRLLDSYEHSARAFHDPLSSVCAYRELDNYHQQLARGLPARVVFPPVGSFLSFDVVHYLRRAVHKCRLRGKRPSSVVIPHAPYGGYLLPTALIQAIGFPPEKYFLYVDDTVWTQRATHAGHAITLDFRAIIHDVDGKWSRSARGPKGLLMAGDSRKMYYSVRNRVHFERGALRNRVDRLRYAVNQATYLTLALLVASPEERRGSLQMLRRAVQAGERGEFTLI